MTAMTRLDKYPVIILDDIGYLLTTTKLVASVPHDLPPVRHINDWLELMHDEENNGILLPIMALAHEHDQDPELRSYKKPVSPELREKLLAGVIAGATLIYEYFAPQRIAYAKSQHQQSTVRHEQLKTGRNDPCPCGSGLKYKKMLWESSFALAMAAGIGVRFACNVSIAHATR
jgi:hypothetical protein